MTTAPKRVSLLWRILLSTSIALTAVFAVTGWTVQRYASRVSERSLEEEVRTSLQAYQSLWGSRTHTLAAVSRIISSMSDVRAAFMTRDGATIRDTAQELWSQISEQDAVFLVLDPRGSIIASLGGDYSDFSADDFSMRSALQRFPRQVSGYLARRSHLYYVVLTPVYVQAGRGQALLNVLLAGFEVNNQLAYALKGSTHGSDFVFVSGDRLTASSIPSLGLHLLHSARSEEGDLRRLTANGTDYLMLSTRLEDIDGKPIGELNVVRSFTGPRRVLTELQRNVALIWLLAVAVGLALTYLLARRILKPVNRLDRAAAEVTKRNYDYRVPVETDDELGRLAQTFNTMCDSIRSAREELIRQERISTIGRFSTSIVHDLRNPLAAIYGGAEMLVDSDLTPLQSKRIAGNIYQASRRIQGMLQDLVNVSRGKAKSPEICRLADVVNAAHDVIRPSADSNGVSIAIDIPEVLELPLERARMERVFINLMNNAVEAMPEGGQLQINARPERDAVIVEIDDTGVGISKQLRATLFQPFASFGKKTGLGLGLALSRQTVLDQGGDIWAAEKSGPGARFLMRFPLSTLSKHSPSALDVADVAHESR